MKISDCLHLKRYQGYVKNISQDVKEFKQYENK